MEAGGKTKSMYLHPVAEADTPPISGLLIP